MRSRLWLPGLLAVLLANSGCYTYRIYSRDGEKSFDNKVPGLPFYSVKAVCEKETAWIEPEHSLSVSGILEVGTGSEASQTVVSLLSRSFSLGQFRSHLYKKLPVLRSAVRAGDATSALRICKELEKLPEFVPVGAMTDQQLGSLGLHEQVYLEGNIQRTVARPDYSRRFFLNAKRPPIGTASISGKLAADGTLTESSASVADETLSSLVGLFPVKERFQSMWIKPSSSAVAAVDGDEKKAASSTLKLEMAYEVRRLRHVLSTATGKQCPDDVEGTARDQLTLSMRGNVDYRVEDADSAPAKRDAEAKKDDAKP